MRCPQCRDEYEADVTECVHCHVPLVPSDQPLPPRVDAHLGRFHPVVATRIVELVERRGIAYETDRDEIDRDRHDPDGDALDTTANDEVAPVTIVVDRDFRDDLRAELAVDYSDLVGRLPTDEMYAVLAVGGPQPGWYDAPKGAWVDRQGRLQVEPAEDELAGEEEGRTIGPALLTIGVVLALFGWYGGGSNRAGIVLVGVALAVTGAFTPR